jgi:hypothetical protein
MCLFEALDELLVCDLLCLPECERFLARMQESQDVFCPCNLNDAVIHAVKLAGCRLLAGIPTARPTQVPQMLQGKCFECPRPVPWHHPAKLAPLQLE